MSDPFEIQHPFTLHHDDGTSTILSLTPNEMEKVGLSLIFHADSLRPKDDRPIFKQPKIMVVETPTTALAVQKDEEGKRSIAIVWKMNGMRPVWLWYDADVATKLAHDILTVSADDGPIVN